MAVRTDIAIGIQVCEALGLDPSEVRCLTLEFEVGDIVNVTVKKFLYVDQGVKLQEILSKYTLTEIETPHP